MATVTAKIQIYVSDSDAESLTLTSNAYRKACNWLSGKVFETKECNQRNLHALYYKELRNTFGLKSQMAQSVMKTVLWRLCVMKGQGRRRVKAS